MLRRKYDAGYGVKSLAAISAVISFFEERRGMLYGFRWRDRADCRSCAPDAVPSPLDQQIGIGNGMTASFQLTKTYAMTYARDGIRSACIAPGAIPHFVEPDAPNARADAQTAGRLGVTYEIGPLAVFLASDSADYLSGETVLIDGGAIAAGVLPAGLVPVAEG